MLLGTGCADLALGMDQTAPDGDTAADAPAAPAPANPAPANPAPAPAGSATPVQVGLSEWKVTPDMPSVAAGMVSFTADNVGEAPHELLVVRADSLADLPLDGNGAVVESKLPKGAVIGEIEKIASKTSQAATFDLEPGRYALICNLVHIDGDIIESHYEFGMGTEFEVTAK